MNKDKHKILNKNFKTTYQNFLHYLLQVYKLKPEHYLLWSQYLLLQDRIEESIAIYKKIDPTQTANCQIQYDYMSCYIDIQQGYPFFKVARLLVDKYVNYPVTQWRNMFIRLKNQLDEFDGDQVVKGQENEEVQISKNQMQADKEEALSSKMSMCNGQHKLEISYTNLKQVTIKYYIFDLEVLFSIHPFIKQNYDQFSLIQPNYVEKLELKFSDVNQVILYDLPKHFAGKNLYIQIIGLGKKNEVTHFANNLTVQTFERQGVIKVTDDQKRPISRVYMKCFVQMKNNSEQFYRDGYTDMNGKFEYMASNRSDMQDIKKLALLIISEKYGQLVIEVDPPKEITE